MRKSALVFVILVLFASHAVLAMVESGFNLVDPPVVLSNASAEAVTIKWQTSIPGVAASPPETHTLAPGDTHEFVRHANFWVAQDNPSAKASQQFNTIEVWVYGAGKPNRLLAYYRTVRELYPSNMVKKDKTVILEIDVSKNHGIDVKLDRFR